MDKKISNGQCYSLNSLLKDCIQFAGGDPTREARLYILSQLLDKKVNSSKELSELDWQKVRDDAYPDWSDGIWEESDAFKGKIARLYEDFLEEQGQSSLMSEVESELTYEIDQTSREDDVHSLVTFRKSCPECDTTLEEKYLVEHPITEEDKKRPEESLSQGVALHRERKH